MLHCLDIENIDILNTQKTPGAHALTQNAPEEAGRYAKSRAPPSIAVFRGAPR